MQFITVYKCNTAIDNIFALVAWNRKMSYFCIYNLCISRVTKSQRRLNGSPEYRCNAFLIKVAHLQLVKNVLINFNCTASFRAAAKIALNLKCFMPSLTMCFFALTSLFECNGFYNCWNNVHLENKKVFFDPLKNVVCFTKHDHIFL